MMSLRGWRRFEDNVRKVGGFSRLVKSNYARNLWHILDKFQVLPTDPRFYNLTEDQVSFILASMVEDNKELQGVQNDVVDEDFDYEGELNLDDHAEETAKGMEKLNQNMPEEIRRTLEEKMAEARAKAEELAKGIDNSQRAVEGRETVARKIEEAQKIAKVLDKTGMSYDDYIIQQNSSQKPALNYEDDDEDVDSI